MSKSVRRTPHVTVPIYVAAAALPAPRATLLPRATPPPYGFAVNEECFYEDTCDNDQANNYIEFEVYTERSSKAAAMGSRYDLASSTPTDSDPESDCEEDAPLQITDQHKVPGGCIINSNVYLSDLQWHTLVTVDGKLVKCAVCELFCDIDTMHQHAAGSAHERSLQRCPPLHKFDMSVTRKIRDSYHCAVCNQIFKTIEHFGSKTHEGNLLFAINKATDILYNFHGHRERDVYKNDTSRDTGLMYSNDNADVAKKDCYYFNINNIRDNESVGSDTYHDNSEYINYQGEFHNDMMVDEEYEEPEVPISGISYAKMAKKPKIECQQFIEVDLGNKKVKVRFDSWHMVICPKANRFYCMVCKKLDHIRHKSEHCSETEHLSNLQRCAVVEAYEEYFIRQVDDKLYHCGHCNNLQLIHEMIDHVESNHPRRTRLTSETKPVKQTSVKQTPVNLTPVKQKPPQQTPVQHTPVKSNNNSNNNAPSPVVPAKNAFTSATANRSINFGPPVKSDVDRYPVKTENNENCPRNAQSIETTVQTASSTIPIYKTSPPKSNYSSQSVKTSVTSNNQIVTYVNSSNDQPTDIRKNTMNQNQNNNNDYMNRNNIILTDIRSREMEYSMNINNLDQSQIFPDIEIYPFGCKMVVPVLSYNVVLRRNTDFYCGLCDLVCPNDSLKNHICEIHHVELLQRTPFIVYFKHNLIRAIRESFHCTICNNPITAAKILSHSNEAIHVSLLMKCLRDVPKELNDQRHDVSAKETQGATNISLEMTSNLPKLASQLAKIETDNTKSIANNHNVNKPELIINNCNNVSQGTYNMGHREKIPAQITSNMAEIRTNVPQIGNKASQIGNNPSQVNNNVPQIGNNLAQIGNNVAQFANPAQVNHNAPQFGNNVPDIGNKAPQISNNTAQSGNNVVQFGNPAQVKYNVPQIGNNAPEIGNNTAQFGNKAPQIGNNLAQSGNNATQIGNNAPQIGKHVGQTDINVAQSTNRSTQYSYVRPKGTPNALDNQGINKTVIFPTPTVNKAEPFENKAPVIKPPCSFGPNMPKVFSVKHTAPSTINAGQKNNIVQDNNNFPANKTQGINNLPNTNNNAQDANNLAANIGRPVTKAGPDTSNIVTRPIIKATKETQNLQNNSNNNKQVHESNSQSNNNSSVFASIAANIANVASYVGQKIAKYEPSVTKMTLNTDKGKPAFNNEDDKLSKNTANVASISKKSPSDTIQSFKDSNTKDLAPNSKIAQENKAELIEDIPFVMPDFTKPPPNMVAFMNDRGNLAPILPHTAPAMQHFAQKDKQVSETDTEEPGSDAETENDEDEEIYTSVEEESVDQEELVEDGTEMDATFESMASEDATFDMEEYVYLKLKNAYIKISNTSYNTLVYVGDGSSYCFVCSEQVRSCDLQKHVDSRAHLQSLEGYRFLDKYEDHLLRQNFLMYHCAICNVIVTRKELRTHLEWPEHTLQNENTFKNIKKLRKNEIKGGVKNIVVSTQKENIYLNEHEPPVNIYLNVRVRNKKNGKDAANTVACDVKQSEGKKKESKPKETPRKNKIIIFNDMVLKVSWESWHGVCQIRTGYKCNLCQKELPATEIDTHCASEWHRYSLAKQIETDYAPALIRRINESTLNCVVCNTELSNKSHLVAEHVNGKRHAKNYETLLAESSKPETGYDDCDEDVFTIN